MKDKDYGVIISKIDYSESSYIIQIFTSKNGLTSFIYRGAKKRKEQFKVFALSIVEVEYLDNKKSDLHMITSLSTYINTSQNFLNPIKSSIVFFLTEILQKTLKTQDNNVEILSFLIARLKYLDLEENPANFHIYFILDYSNYLGFYPSCDLKDLKEVFFDLQEGVFLPSKPLHEFYVAPNESEVLRRFLNSKFDSEVRVNLNGIKRIRILEILTTYYKFQIESFGSCKSLEILETIFND